MTRTHLLSAHHDEENPPTPPSECACRDSRTRRDLLAMAFGCTAAVAAAGIRTPARAGSNDVFDGGAP
jgi:hypothetical protein